MRGRDPHRFSSWDTTTSSRQGIRNLLYLKRNSNVCISRKRGKIYMPTLREEGEKRWRCDSPGKEKGAGAYDLFMASKN